MTNLEFDRQHIWHPYNKIPSAHPQLEVVSAQGSHIHLATGETLVDAMSSWWSSLHGYSHPVINGAAIAQVQQLSHIMFGGFTHQPAVQLAKQLIEISPQGLDKVFFADSGSVSIEVALKVALQYWKSVNRPEKHRFLALQHAYHGDTFGAMSVCDPQDGMHHLFSDNLMQNIFAPAPQPGLVVDHNQDIEALEALFEQHHTQLAAFILEPLVQGAGGMRFYRPAYLKRARELCDQYEVLLIADEIATGFGRTGKLFACEWAGISPDIMCLGKALTAGYMTLAAMLCSQHISDTISQAEPGLLMHGPTFMGNPLACRIALASLELLLSGDWQQQVNHINQRLSAELSPLEEINGVKEVRVMGAIGVVELESGELGYQIQQSAKEQGVWLRPFGKLVYTMPAYNIPEEDLSSLIHGIKHAVSETLSQQPTQSNSLVDQFV